MNTENKQLITAGKSPTVNKWVWLLAAVLLVGAIVGVVAFILAVSEPVYGGKQLTEWLIDLESDTPFENRKAAEVAIKKIGPRALPTVRRWLRKGDSWMNSLHEAVTGKEFDYQYCALRACKALGPDARSVMPEVIGFLQSSEMPLMAAEALAAIGPEAISPLASALNHTNSEVRSAVVWSLRELESQADQVIPLLLKALKDSHVNVRSGAASSLSVMRTRPNLVVPELAAGLSDTNAQVRNDIFHAIRTYGSNGIAAMPVLERLVGGSNGATRVYASVILRDVDPARAEQADLSTSQLLTKLHSQSNEAKLESMEILWWSTRDRNVVIPALSSCLADTNTEIRMRAMSYLPTYGGKAKQAVPALARLLEDSQLEVRKAATSAINGIDPDFLTTLPK